MDNFNNLKDLTAEISNYLLNTISILDIFKEITEGDRKEDFLISAMQNNIHNAFDNTELCRQIISKPD